MDEYALMSSLDNPHIAKTYEAFKMFRLISFESHILDVFTTALRWS